LRVGNAEVESKVERFHEVSVEIVPLDHSKILNGAVSDLEKECGADGAVT
jgi:hypothetical protein